MTFTITRLIVNLQESDDARLQERDCPLVVWTGDLTTCHEFEIFYIWHIYYSGIVTFTTARPSVNLQESGDARLQERYGPPNTVPFLKPDVVGFPASDFHVRPISMNFQVKNLKQILKNSKNQFQSIPHIDRLIRVLMKNPLRYLK